MGLLDLSIFGYGVYLAVFEYPKFESGLIPFKFMLGVGVFRTGCDCVRGCSLSVSVRVVGMGASSDPGEIPLEDFLFREFAERLDLFVLFRFSFSLTLLYLRPLSV